jgi:rod shape-determining protein MreD
VFIAAAAVLQSTLLARVPVFGATPDIALVILVYTAYEYGVMIGQASGFAGGLLLDFLSAAPLGFNMLLRTSLGAGVGLLKGNFSLDAIFLPAALAAVATLAKAALLLLIRLLFTGATPAYSLPVLSMELLFNALLAP